MNIKFSKTAFIALALTLSHVQAFGILRSQAQRTALNTATTAQFPVTKIAPAPTNLPSVQIDPTLVDTALNNFQIWALGNPRNPVAKTLLPPISFFEGMIAILPWYLNRKRAMFGPNFCCAGQVVMGDFAAVEKALTEPQARTYRLGCTFLNESRLMVNGRKVFSLAMSDPEISMEGYADGRGHTEVMKLVKNAIINEKSFQRQRDDTAKRLLQEVAQDYAEMDHTMEGEFFTSCDRGLQRFLIRYQHYVLFGLDPDDKAAMDLLTQLYFGSQGTVYFLKGIGDLVQSLNVNGARNWPKMWKEAKEIYRRSPALAPLQYQEEVQPGFTFDELLEIMLPTLGLAALPGPLSLCTFSLGGKKMPFYPGHATEKIDPAVHWDAIADLNDRDALERHVYETGRLWMPVSATHRVATEDMEVPMMSSIKDGQSTVKSFPAGTIVMIPMSLGMLDEGVWGPTAYEYDASRPKLCPFSMLFNSVGNRCHGRMCPGKDLSMNLLVDLLREVGQVRRASQQQQH